MLHVRTSRDSIQFWFIVGKNTLKTKWSTNQPSDRQKILRE